jgi:hypothetical protein
MITPNPNHTIFTVYTIYHILYHIPSPEHTLLPTTISPPQTPAFTAYSPSLTKTQLNSAPGLNVTSNLKTGSFTQSSPLTGNATIFS